MAFLPEDANRILAEKLFAAVRMEQAEDAEKYLCLGANPDYIMLNGHSPFHIAAGSQRSKRFVNLMLKYDGNPNVRNVEGLTPLHIATSWGKIDSMRLLIENGADIHVQDEEGRDLMAFAELNGSPNCMEYAQSLLSNGSLSNTPKTSKLFAHGLVSFKENRNPNQKTFAIDGLHDALDKTDKCVGTSILLGSQIFPGHSDLHSTGTDICTGMSSLKILPEQCGGDDTNKYIGTSTLANLPVCPSPNITNTCVLPGQSDTDDVDKCVGTSTLTVLRDHHHLDSADKCVGTSVLLEQLDSGCATDCLVSSTSFGDSNNADKKSRELKHAKDGVEHNDHRVSIPAGSKSQSEECITLRREQITPRIYRSACARTPENRTRNASPESKSLPATVKNDQIQSSANMQKQNMNSNILSPCQGVPFECDSTETLQNLPCEDLSHSANELETGNLSSYARNVLLSTKMALAKSEVAEFFGKNFINTTGKFTDGPESPEHCTLNLLKFSKPHGADHASKSKPLPICSISSKTDETKEYTDAFRNPANENLQHTVNASSLPLGKSTRKPSESHLKSSSSHHNVSMLPGSGSWHSLQEVTTSGNMHQCMSPTSKSNLIKTVTEPPISGPPCSPIDMAKTCVNARQYAAASPYNYSNPNSESAPKVSRERLHSTVLHQTLSDIDLAEDISWDISVIKADSLPVSHSEETLQQATSESLLGKPCTNSPESQMSDLSNDATIIYNWKSYWEGEPIPESAKLKRKKHKTPDKKCHITRAKSKPSTTDLDNLTNGEIREKLVALGVSPGPIPVCREIYLKKLASLLSAQAEQCNDPVLPRFDGPSPPKFSPELEKHVGGLPLPESVIGDDDIIRQQFEQPDPNISWREGTAKSSFTYLLLDPRVTNELPIRAKFLTHMETFRAFIGAIFYIGKGKESRPFHHFSEALQVKQKPSHKVQHIRSIWAAGLGVVALHVYQNTIACEAYTREAAMIDAVGLAHLTNCKRGEYYGEASRWILRRKREYGSFLLEKALKVLMVEGERQIKPTNLESRRKRKGSNLLHSAVKSA